MVQAARKISAEAMKAETKLVNMDKARQTLIDRQAMQLGELEAKREAFIEDLPPDVVAMLVAGGVITEEEATRGRAQ